MQKFLMAVLFVAALALAFLPAASAHSVGGQELGPNLCCNCCNKQRQSVGFKLAEVLPGFMGKYFFDAAAFQAAGCGKI